MPRKKEQNYLLGKTCPRCRGKNVIFTGVEKAASPRLPIRGNFLYPCKFCNWTMTCSVESLEELDEEKPPE